MYYSLQRCIKISASDTVSLVRNSTCTCNATVGQDFIAIMPKREIRIIRGREGYGFTVYGEAPCVVSWISDSSYAKDAGLKVGDSIVSINREDILTAGHEYVVQTIGMSSGVLIMEVSDEVRHPVTLREDADLEDLTILPHGKTNHNGGSPSLANGGSNVGESKFYRTKRVLNELKNGSLFQDVRVALDSNPTPKDRISRTGTAPRLKTRTSWPSRENNGDTLPRSNSVRGFRNPDGLILQVIVSYLGTKCGPAEKRTSIRDMCLQALQASIRQLRSEQDIHQRVLLKLTTKCLKVFNADGDLMVLLDGHKLCFCSACDEDERFFSIATLHNGKLVECYQFMVDPALSTHDSHNEQAKRFGIHCTVDSLGCLEFPDSPVTIIEAIDMMFGLSFLNIGAKRTEDIPSISNENESFGNESFSTSMDKPTRQNDKGVDGMSYSRRAKSLVSKLNKKNLSKSTESVRCPDPDYASRTSSFESLNGSNVELWSISFDGLLSDPVGLRYFSEYLCQEFSEENITFWIECEKLKNTSPSDTASLGKLASAIYKRFLSSEATSSVNIDSSARRLADEALAEAPHPGMFLLQQNQIYKLMEYDSYRRFLKSKLYSQCQWCQVNGLPLPLEKEPSRKNSHNENERSKNVFSLQSRKFFQKKPKKSRSINEIRKDVSDFDSASMISSRSEDDTLSYRRLSDVPSCKLMFWDGSSSIIPVEEGKMSIREALDDICDKRNTSVSAVDVYYQDENRALALDQDIAVLAGQEARVERRTLFKLDMHPIGRTIGVKAKPSKSTIAVLKPLMAKYGLDCDQLTIRLSGEEGTIDLSKPVSMLDGFRVSVDNNLPRTMPRKPKAKAENQEQKSHSAGNSDTDDLILLAMSAAESGKLNDQCGLISQNKLELPDFLKLPPPQNANASSKDSKINKQLSKQHKR